MLVGICQKLHPAMQLTGFASWLPGQMPDGAHTYEFIHPAMQASSISDEAGSPLPGQM